jgi:hypothetical protein
MHSLNSPLDLNLKTSENPVWCLGGIPNDMREGFFGYARGGLAKMEGRERRLLGHGSNIRASPTPPAKYPTF